MALAVVPDVGTDPEVTLLLPEQDVADPEFSIVIPALNGEVLPELVSLAARPIDVVALRGRVDGRVVYIEAIRGSLSGNVAG
ncbi:MAG: hypothetical protein ABI488_06695 [Polyangiaceae bacterium]